MSAPPETNTVNPSAHPNPNVITGRTNMQRFAASLVANRTINMEHNGLNYPYHFQKLNAHICLSMFVNILKPLVFANYRALGAQTATNQNDVNTLNAITSAIAFSALENLFIVLYHKALRLTSSAATLFGTSPPLGSNMFPAFVSALINSFGPVQFDDVPARGTHIPYFSNDDLIAERPAQYEPFRIGIAIEAFERAKLVALASVDAFATQSSPWWTFHSWSERIRNGVTTHSLWSPVKFNQCDDSLKLGVLFAKEKLTEGPGVVNFSATPFIDINDPPRPQNFPAGYFQFPFYNESQPAYFRLLERDPPVAGSPSYTPTSPDMGISSAASSANEQPSTRQSSKKRKLPDGSSTAESAETVVHRAVYFYYDHRVMMNINDTQLDIWTLELNKA